MSKKFQKNGIISLLLFIKDMREIDDQMNISFKELRLLEIIAEANFSDQELAIKDLIHRKDIASQACLSYIVSKMIRKGLITAHSHEDDGRRKVISLTKISRSRFQYLHNKFSEYSVA